MPVPLTEAFNLIQRFEDTFGKFDFKSTNKKGRQEGAYYLASISKVGKRVYERHHSAKVKSMQILKWASSPVTWIDFLQDSMDELFVEELISTLEPGRIHIFSSSCDNFCVGASAAGVVDPSEFIKNISKYEDLCARLEMCELPIISICNGATRGGGMLFPAVSDIVLSTKDANFGYPEIRRGVLPGLVSVFSRKRLNGAQCRRWMMTGLPFGAVIALDNGFVDELVTGSKGQIELKVNEIVAAMLQVPHNKLCCQSRIKKSSGLLDVAIVEAATIVFDSPLDNHEDLQSDRLELVQMCMIDAEVALINLYFPDESCTAESMMKDLTKCFDRLISKQQLRLVLVSISGDQPIKLDSKRLFKNSTESFESSIATNFRLMSMCSQIWNKLDVPVIAILKGNVFGMGLVFALRADYRIAVSGLTLEFGDHDLNNFFDIGHLCGQLVGEAKWAKFVHGMTVDEVDGENALHLGIISSIHETSIAAETAALKLADTIKSSPVDGVRNSLKLLRIPAKKEYLAAKCVQMCVVNPKRMISEPLLNVVSSGCQIIVDLLPATTIRQLVYALHNSSTLSNLKTITIMQTSTGDMCEAIELSGDLLSLVAWLRKVNRPELIVTCNGCDLSIMLAVLSDGCVSSPNTTFRTSNLFHPVVFASFIQRAHHRGYSLLYSANRAVLSAANALEVCIVTSISETLVTEDLCLRDRLDSSPSALIEEVFLEIESNPEELDLTPANLTYFDSENILLRLNGLQEIKQALRYLETCGKSFDGIFIDATHTEAIENLSEKFLYVAILTQFKQCLQLVSSSVYTIVNGSPLTALAITMLCASDYRIGSSKTCFDFGNELASSMIFDIINDALPSVIGPSETEKLRFKRSVIGPEEALVLGLLTQVFDDEDFAAIATSIFSQSRSPQRVRVHNLCSRHPMLASTNSYDRSVALMESLPIPIVKNTSTISSDEERTLDSDSVIRITISTPISSLIVESICRAIKPKTALHVIYIEPSGTTETDDVRHSFQHAITCVSRLLMCTLPVIVVYMNENYISREETIFMRAADFVVINETIRNGIWPKPDSPIRHVKDFDWHISRRDINVGQIFIGNVDEHVISILKLFRKLDLNLIATVKTLLPASCIEKARIVMDLALDKRIRKGNNHVIVKLNILSDGVAIVTLNNLTHYNALSDDMMANLFDRIEQVDQLARDGLVKCLILHGKDKKVTK